MFPKLNFPQYSFKIEKQNDQYFIWDELRKKRLVLTPEEWVRQHVIQFFAQELNYPTAYIKSEHPIPLGEHTQRADLVMYNLSKKPKIVVECKAPDIKINQTTVDQASRYNYQLNASILIVTNGLQHLVYAVHKNHLELVDAIPNWSEVNQ